MTLALRITTVFLFFCSSLPLSAWANLPPYVNGQPLPSLADMLQHATPTVVNISTRSRRVVRSHPFFDDPIFRKFFGPQFQERESQGLGSGVIVDARRGYVLTNNHVIEGAQDITVTLNDGRYFEANVIGGDAQSDVAVIQIEPKNLRAIRLGNSEQLRVGDFVVAIGNPFGLGQTVTSGIISALGRSGLGIEDYEDFIQTDASINPGNSGGALVNLNGELIGLNTAILGNGSGGNVGIGFAIPVNMAINIMDQLINYGTVERGFLGVEVQDLDPDLAQAFNLRLNQGAVVVHVLPNSPAARAGLEASDVILGVNGQGVRSAADVKNKIGALRIGTKVEMDVIRGGQRLPITAVIAPVPREYETGNAVIVPVPR